MSEQCAAETRVTRRAARSRGRWLLLGVLLGAVVLAAGCEKPPPTVPEHMQRPRATGVATPLLKVGDPLPPLKAEGWLNGDPPAPDAARTRLLVVDLWGMWCPYCGESAPNLVRLYEKYSGQGVSFVGLTTSDRELVEHYTKKYSIKWPNGYGATAEMIAALGAGSGMLGPIDYEIAPTVYLVGRDGRVRWVDGRGRARHQEAEIWEKAVDEAIAEALAGSPKSAP